jgi:DNA topoisomerase-2
MAGEEQESMLPWWRSFKGTIKKTDDHKYNVTGIASKMNDTTIEVTELPIHKWTQNYKAELEAMIGEKGDGVVRVRAPGHICRCNDSGVELPAGL